MDRQYARNCLERACRSVAIASGISVRVVTGEGTNKGGIHRNLAYLLARNAGLSPSCWQDFGPASRHRSSSLKGITYALSSVRNCPVKQEVYQAAFQLFATGQTYMTQAAVVSKYAVQSCLRAWSEWTGEELDYGHMVNLRGNKAGSARRGVFWMASHLAGWRAGEIAANLGTTRSTVSNSLAKARYKIETHDYEFCCPLYHALVELDKRMQAEREMGHTLILAR